MADYPETKMGLIVCRVDKPQVLAEKIMAIPWQDLPEYLIKVRV